MAKKKLIEWVVCGRIIGKASGWDMADDFAIILYDFVPAKGYKGPVDTPTINFIKGTIEIYDDSGEISEATDLIDAIKDLERKTE